MTSIILASSSQYRQQQLKQLVKIFRAISPDINESSLKNETPEDLVKRLSESKANKIAKQYPNSWVIGSDQLAYFNGAILGKPKSAQKAQEQLNAFSGNCISFLTGVALINNKQQFCAYKLNKTQVYFKRLSPQLIKNYVQVEQPLDCAGSFKVESYGPMLFEKVVTNDPSALQGLPLILLGQLFDLANIDILKLNGS